MTKYITILLLSSSVTIHPGSAQPARQLSGVEEDERESSGYITSSLKENLRLFFISDTSADNDRHWHFLQQVQNFIADMKHEKSRSKSHKIFLRYFFYELHANFLKTYQKQISFYDLVAYGKYDCLTATALYAILLDELGYRYQIHEQLYHVYLLIDLPGYAVLMEATDPVHGFEDAPNAIAKRLQYYEESNRQAVGLQEETSFYRFSSEVDALIDLEQLAGLHLYNQAVLHYNQQYYQEAYQLMARGLTLYHSNRMEEFMELLMNNLLSSESLSNKTKREYLKNYLSELKKRQIRILR